MAHFTEWLWLAASTALCCIKRAPVTTGRQTLHTSKDFVQHRKLCRFLDLCLRLAWIFGYTAPCDDWGYCSVLGFPTCRDTDKLNESKFRRPYLCVHVCLWSINEPLLERNCGAARRQNISGTLHLSVVANGLLFSVWELGLYFSRYHEEEGRTLFTGWQRSWIEQKIKTW